MEAQDAETILRHLPGSRLLSEILADLKKPIHPKHISQKATGKYKADYVHHVTIRDYLDHYAPGWESHVRISDAAGKLYVTVSLTLHGSDGEITREGIGNADDNIDGYGDPSSNAHAMALRRAAMEFGLGRALWRK